MSAEWTVGQKIIVSDTQNRIHEAVVTKIARVNFYVLWHGEQTPFDRKTGRCKERRYDFGHGVTAYPVERYAQMQRRKDLVSLLRGRGIELSYRATFTDEQLERILAAVINGADA